MEQRGERSDMSGSTRTSFGEIAELGSAGMWDHWLNLIEFESQKGGNPLLFCQHPSLDGQFGAIQNHIK